MKRLFSKIVMLAVFALAFLNTSYANEALSTQKTYILRATSDTENQPVNFMVSYLYKINSGELAHYQVTRSTPWEVTVNADNLHALFSTLTANQKLHVAILQKTNHGDQFMGSAIADAIVITADRNTSIEGM